MKICHVIDYGGPTGGSFIPCLRALARAVRARGDDFAVLASEVPNAAWPQQLAEAGAELRVVRRDADVIAALRALRPEVIHSHFNRYDLPVLFSSPRARLFWHIHSHRETFSPTAKAKAFLKYRILGANVEALVAVSRAVFRDCLAFGAPSERVRVVHNGIDVRHFRPPAPAERAAARARFGIERGDRVVLFFERVPYKGGSVVCTALCQLEDCRLLVAGGSKADRERFLVLPRAITIERAAEARELYWAADALAFASTGEAFGFVLAEALACGVPVAASDIPVVHEICAELPSIFLFPPGNSAALAASLQRALLCTDTDAGRARVCERFSLERWTQDMLSLYQGSGATCPA